MKTRDRAGRDPSRPSHPSRPEHSDQSRPGQRSERSSDRRTGASPSQAPSPHSLGAEGEKRAARHLERRGYRIVDRNVRAGGVELDLVARRGRWLVFVEVKTRRSRRFGDPELAVDAAKQARLVRGAAAWLQTHAPHAGPIRFDVIGWQVSPTGPQGREEWQLRHLKSAFEAGG